MSALLDYVDSYLSIIHESLPPQLQLYFTRTNIQQILRVIVIISTYIMFKPHLESLYRTMTGKPDSRQEEIQARLEFLRKQKEGGGAGGGPKNVGIVGNDGQVHRVVGQKQNVKAKASANTSKGKDGKKRKA